MEVEMRLCKNGYQNKTVKIDVGMSLLKDE
jgi:hypothetical protein